MTTASATTTDTGDARSDLTTRLLEHLRAMWVTGEEAPLADALEQRYRSRGEVVRRVGDSLVVGGPKSRPDAGKPPGVPSERWSGTRPLVLLVGHLDVVPPTDDDLDPRTEHHHDGTEVVVGRGASDMKAGNVVAMRAFEDAHIRTHGPYELALVLYAGEEGAAEGNELRSVLQAVPWLADAALAVVLEPTDGRVELGCLGGLHALVRFHGRQAHSARPWHGRNALTMAGGLLADLERDHVRDVEVEGIDYRDVWSATQAWSEGFGPGSDPSRPPFRNVIPGGFTVNLNLRFAPSRSLEEAEAELRARVAAAAGAGGGEGEGQGEGAGEVSVEVIDRAPPTPPNRHAPVLQAFVDAVDAEVAGKQAWTDVARFAEIDVPACNYGPGLTGQAHQRGEYVPVDALVEADTRLRRFLLANPGRT